MKKLLLVDGMAMIYRAHFAFMNYPRRNSKNLNTGCIYGFVNSWLEAVNKESPSHWAVAFDTPAPTFRHKLYEEYKIQRDKQPEEITEGLPWVIRVLEAFHVPVLLQDGYEADDLIGTLARQGAEAGHEVVIVTPDKDFAQLIGPHTFLYLPAGRKKPVQRIGLKELKDCYGVEQPAQMIDLLALQGDATDNIPGVTGIGIKTAQRLLDTYKGIDPLLAAAEAPSSALPPRIASNLGKEKEKLMLSRQLATINQHVKLAISLEDCARTKPMDRASLTALFDELEFRQLARRILGQKE